MCLCDLFTVTLSSRSPRFQHVSVDLTKRFFKSFSITKRFSYFGLTKIKNIKVAALS